MVLSPKQPDSATLAGVQSETTVPPERSFRQGLRDALPIVLGYLPIGLSYGVIAQQAGLSTFETVAMSLIVYAGSAQFAGAALLAQAAGTATIVGTTFLLNLRHLLFSAALAPRIRERRLGRLAVAAYWITDEVFAIAQTRLHQKPNPLWYLYGLEIAAYLTWSTASWLGATLGQALSGLGEWGLDYALPAMFLALIALQLGARPRARLAVAVFAAVASLGLRSAGLQQLQVLIAALLGAGLGVLIECYGPRSSSSSS